jgi:hypothetical protein
VLQSGFAALDAAALIGPVEEAFELVAILPAQLEELGGGHVGGFGAQEGFKAPAEIGAVPGIEAIALGGEPVVAEKLPHSFVSSGIMTWRGAGAGVFWRLRRRGRKI